MHQLPGTTTKEPFMRTEQAARLVMHTPETLKNWRCYKKGPPFYKIGRQVFYKRSDLLAWVESQRKEPIID